MIRSNFTGDITKKPGDTFNGIRFLVIGCA